MNINSISNKMKIAATRNIKERNYWLKQLSGDLVKSSFPYDFRNNGSHEECFKTIKFEFSNQLMEVLLKISNNSDSRLHMILLAGLVILLHKYTDNDDIIVGIPIYKQEIEGEFVNTILPIRIKLGSNITFKQLLLLVRHTNIEAAHHQNYPMETLFYKLDIPSSPTGFPLFDVAVLLENIHYKSYLEHINYNILFSFLRKGESLEGTLEYNTLLYRQTTGQQIVTHLQQLFKEIILNLNISITRINILSEEEKKRVLLDFNNTGVEYQAYKTIHAWLEAQVLKIPAKIALIYNHRYLTYQVLNQRANQLAGFLGEKCVKTDSIVGILISPCLELIIGIFAVLKAGGAYLPIDLTYPAKRISSIIGDSGVSILLIGGQIPGQYLVKNQDMLLIDIESLDLTRFPGENPPQINQSGDILYLISTSGSTGIPKSLVMEHRNLVNLLNFQIKATAVNFQRVLQFASIGFDVASQEIFSTLLAGGRLYLIDSHMKQDIYRLLEWIRKNQINVIYWPPAFLKYVFSEPDHCIRFPKSVQHIISAGEQLVITESVRRAINKYRFYIHNQYGPAETHVVTTFVPESPNSIPALPPIGKPIANIRIFILNENKHLKPIGTIGELYISGDNVGRGYLNQPELTAKKFDHDLWDLQDYHDKKKSNQKLLRGGRLGGQVSRFLEKTPPYASRRRRQKIYKTGDLARWLPDGNIEFMGRADFQVKIRGFRIEPGEIENRLRAYKGIQDAVVIEHTGNQGENRLCAYFSLTPSISSDSSNSFDSIELSNFLSRTLPDYMIPTRWVQLDKIPVSPNGKVDRKSLPEPGILADKPYVAPVDEFQKKLVKIWSDILKIDKESIGIDDNFFELGGHSLKATKLISRIHKELKVKITLPEIFKTSSIRKLAKYLQRVGQDKYASLQPVEKREYYELSSAQKRIYVMKQMEGEAPVYNMPTLLTVKGKLNKHRLIHAFKKLVIRHESLRTSFQMFLDHPGQKVHHFHEIEFKIEYFKLNNHDSSSVEGITGSFIRPFDLSQAPLLRVGLLEPQHSPVALHHPSFQEGKNQQYILMVDMHHIISDGTSQEILVKELVTLYTGGELLPIRLQYKDYSEWQHSFQQQEVLEQQEKYWLQVFAEAPPVLELPLDYSCTNTYGSSQDILVFEIDARLTVQIKKIISQTGTTLYMLALAVYNILLSKYSGEEDIVVGSGIAGRNHADIQKIIGMFVNMLAMRNYPRENKTFKEFLIEVKENALKAFENQDYQFEELVNKLNIKRIPGRNPLFEVIFSMHNFDMEIIKIHGLILEPYKQKKSVSKFHLLFHLREIENKMLILLAYNEALFRRSTIEKMVDNFTAILRQVVKDIEILIKDIEVSHELKVLNPPSLKEYARDFEF